MPTAMLADTPARVSSQIASGKASTTTISSAGDASFRQENSASPPQLFLRAKKATVAIISSVMTMPGMTPPRNSAPIDTFAIMP